MLPTINIDRILVPIDFSADAEAATSYARLLAASLGASVTLLHVCQIPQSMVGIVPGGSVAGDLAEGIARAEQWLAPVAAALRAELSTDVHTVVLTGHSPSDVIIAHARGFELIVMGTHGRSGWSHLVLGSVAETVMRAAPCPVMTIRFPSHP